jgi:RecB family exonuclease
MINLSKTTITDYLKCPAIVYFKHNFQGESSLQTPAMLVGTVLHDVIEKKWQDRTSALTYLRQQIKLNSLESHEARMTICIDNFFKIFRPMLKESDLIEYRFKTKISGFDVVGRIDRMNKSVILDWKTGKLPFSPETDLQLALYYIVFNKIFKRKPTYVGYCSLEYGKMGGGLPSLETIDTITNIVIPEVGNAIKKNIYYKKGLLVDDCYNCPCKEVCKTLVV